jgi:hypothetical protein
VKTTFQNDVERAALILVESAELESAFYARGLPEATGTEVWNRHLLDWRARGSLERGYSRRPRKAPSKQTRRKFTDLQRAKSMPPKVESGEALIGLGTESWQHPAMIAKAVEMWDAGMSAGAIRQVQCSRIAWVMRCKAKGHLWHRVFRCGLRFCPLCMSPVYEKLFCEAVQRLDPVASRIVPDWPVNGRRPLRVVAKIDFTIRNDGQMPSKEKVRWFNGKIRDFFVRLARKSHWEKNSWGAAWCAEFGPGNTNLHAHAVFCGPWIEQKGREASRFWSTVVGEYAFVSVKAAKSFRHALRHAIKYPAASWKYFSASPERLASLEKSFYTVKRFHTVGAFYNPPKDLAIPPTVVLPYDKCPTCGSPLEELPSPHWISLHEAMRMGSQDHCAWQREQRLLGLAATAAGEGPP